MFKVLEGVDRWTVLSMKLATVSFVLIVLKIWDGAMSWIADTNVWWFVLAFVVFVIRAGMGSGYCVDAHVVKRAVGKRVVKKKTKK